MQPEPKQRRATVSGKKTEVRSNGAVVYVCGTGMRIPGHLTVETMGALQGCHRIFSMLPPYVKDLLPAPLGHQFENLWPLYNPDEPEGQAFEVIVQHVLDAAIAASPVAYLTQGNPLVFDPISQMLIDKGRHLGATVEVRPAISRLDTLLADLEIDLSPGIQIYAPVAAILYGIDLNSDFPCLLIQPCSFGNSVPTDRRFDSVLAIRPLRDYLLQFYPADHEVVSVVPASTLGGRARIDRMALAELGKCGVNEMEAGAMLFLPSVSWRTPEVCPSGVQLGPAKFSISSRKRVFHA
jgi:uncharacterized protein YabN with tetrapyrrole methylase and pyrophosphatase domain